MSSFISIIMPAYNAEKYISSAIESVRSQTYRNWELIIVDDGSTDTTGLLANKFKADDERVLYVHQKNKGLSAARNTGIKHSKGSWIGFLDSDDLWSEDKLEKQLQAASKWSDVDVIYSSGYIFYGENLSDLQLYPTKVGKYKGAEMYKLLYEVNSIPVLSALVRKSWIDKVGFQDETLTTCEDWDYWLRITRAGATFLGLPDTLFYYRRHNQNMSANTLEMEYGKALVLINNFEKQKFSNSEVRKYFKPFVVPLMLGLIHTNKKQEAYYLMEKLFSKIPLISFKLSNVLFRSFKKYSLIPIRAVNKLDTYFNGW